MVRPLRRLYPMPGFKRRRHRSWILSMTCATFALGILGTAATSRRFFDAEIPPLWLAALVSSCFSVPGLGFGFMSLRGRFAWLAYAAVPLIANATLLALPWLLWRSRN